MIEVLHSHFTWLVSGFLFAVALLWTAARSQSLFDVRYRLWRLLRSGHEISDATVRESVQERADFMAFRTLLIWADTPGEMRRISDFARQHELDAGTLGDCGPYFHRRDLIIKKNVPPLRRAKGIYLLACLLFLIVSVFALCWFIQDHAMVSFKDDGTMLWLDMQEARRLGHDKPSLVPDNCPKTNTGMAGFNATHTKVLCEAFGSKGLETTVKNGVVQQHVLGVLLLMFAASGYVFCRRRFQQVRAAHAVKSWLAFREIEGGPS